ncbi:MAG: hypothetical protein CM15mV16_0590 [uncultured marine virus]|nr:MAG: hypothetical protein CM15mV16_0590 [uncultured marine virus]
MSDWELTKQGILSTLSEGVHYEIIPQVDDTRGWDVRLLEEYPETVIRYGNVAFDGKRDALTFNYEIVSSPDPDLEVETNLTFQEYCGKILSSIIDKSITDGSMIAQDKDTGEIMATEENLEWIQDEYKSRTDDT